MNAVLCKIKRNKQLDQFSILVYPHALRKTNYNISLRIMTGHEIDQP